MSSSDAPTTQPASDQVVLPAGVTVLPGRQTTQTSGLGQVVQGTVFGITLANGTSSSVFVPDSALSNVAQVQALFDTKIAQLSIVPVS